MSGEEKDLKYLESHERDRHLGYEYTAKKILLPFGSYEVTVEVKTNVGARDLDKVFLGLLEKGINSEKKIINDLGISKEDKFIMKHLHFLVEAGYVCKEHKKYQLTKEGKKLYKGEDRQLITEIREKKLVWNYMEEYFENNFKNKKKKSESSLLEVSKKDLTEKNLRKEDREIKLEDYWCGLNKEEVFYEIKEFSPQKEIFKIYFVAKYESEEGDFILEIFDEDARHNKRLSNIANRDNFWQEVFLNKLR